MKAKSWIARATATYLMLTTLLGGAASADSVQVTADRLNMRKEANTDSKAVAVVEKDDTLTFVSEADGWYQVSFDGKTGFMMGQYLTLEEESASGSETAPSQGTFETTYNSARQGRTTERVNMRKAATTDSGVAKVLNKGAQVVLLGETGSWYKASASGKTGYVAKAYVSLENEEISAPEDNTSSETIYNETKSGLTTERVNMRKAATTDSGVAKVLDSGEAVSILGEAGNWYRVTSGGKEGYILKSYVAAGLTLYDSPKTGKTRDEVNLRAAATTQSDILKVLPKNTQADVLGYAEGFYQVCVNGMEGYISSEYLSVSDKSIENEDKITEGDAVVPDNFVSYPAARTGATTDRVNLRAAASTSADVSRIINRNTTVSVLGEQGDFYQVKAADVIGYIAKAYIALGETGESAPSEDGDTLYASPIAAKTTVSVNMRREPEGDVLFTLPAGTSVQKIGEKGAWYKVAYGNSTGYIAKDYVSESITVPTQPDSNESTANGKTAYITAQSLNMRRGAGTGYGVIKVLSHGDEITSYSLTDGWYLIKAGSDTGYVSEKYVSFTKPESAPVNPGNESNGKVILSDWWTGDIRSTFKVGVIATVTDVETGISWQVKRSGGTNHADVQPLTAEDTAKMKQAYGGKWSWNRRAIWVTVGGKKYAASMNGMPHGTGSIKTNNFDGHHCIHFLNSRTHTGNRLDSAHQAAVQKAYKAG